MKTMQKNSLMDNIIAAFALGRTFGFGQRNSVRDVESAQKRPYSY